MTVRGWASVVALGAAALVLILALSACGGEGEAEGSNDVASLGGSNGDGDDDGGASSGSSASERRQGALDFARCMREHGIDHPDPNEEGMFEITPETDDRLKPRSAKFQEAAKECGKHLGDMGGPPKLSAEERKALEEQMLAFARCMREQGIDMPDPQFGDGGAFAFEVGGELDPRDPAFRAAEKACREFAPELGAPGQAESDQ